MPQLLQTLSLRLLALLLALVSLPFRIHASLALHLFPQFYQTPFLRLCSGVIRGTIDKLEPRPCERTVMADFEYEKLITDIVDYPKPGIVFKDVTTLFKDPDGLKATIDTIADRFKDAGITKVLGAEARGFVLASPVAYRLGAGLVLARKPGKLPRETFSQEYDLEYGTDELQVHCDSLDKDDVALIVDDLIATGGTAIAQVKLVEQFGAKLAGMAFLMELAFLNPRDILAEVTDAELFSLVQVD